MHLKFYLIIPNYIQSNNMTLYSHQNYWRLLTVLYPHKHFALSDFYIVASLLKCRISHGSLFSLSLSTLSLAPFHMSTDHVNFLVWNAYSSVLTIFSIGLNLLRIDIEDYIYHTHIHIHYIQSEAKVSLQFIWKII